MQPYAPRAIRFLGVREAGPWRLKTYTVSCGDGAVDLRGFGPAIAFAERALPAPDESRGRPGLGFVIAHQGRTADYLVLGWWDHENELPLRVWVRAPGAGADSWREAREGESVCVWDLEVIWAERQAWVGAMMGREGPDCAAYLARVEERWRGGG